MRDITFRSWNNVNMVYWDFHSASYIFTQLNSFPIPFYPLMQYTGLKDKNGKNIYECDILQTDSGIITDVHFNWGKFCVGALSLDYVNRESEVIGNIYENPELLEKVGC